jgi:hypothetical protein
VGKLLNEYFAAIGTRFLEYLLAGIGVWFVEGLAGITAAVLAFAAVFTGLYLESVPVLAGCALGAALAAVALTLLVNTPLHAGTYRAVLARQRGGEELSVGSPFVDLWTDLGRLIALGLVEGLIVWIGLALFVVPGILAAVAMSMAYPAMIVHRLSVGEALRLSVAHARKHPAWHAQVWGIAVILGMVAPWVPLIGNILLRPLMASWQLRAYAVAFGSGPEPIT